MRTSAREIPRSHPLGTPTAPHYGGRPPGRDHAMQTPPGRRSAATGIAPPAGKRTTPPPARPAHSDTTPQHRRGQRRRWRPQSSAPHQATDSAGPGHGTASRAQGRLSRTHGVPPGLTDRLLTTGPPAGLPTGPPEPRDSRLGRQLTRPPPRPGPACRTHPDRLRAVPPRRCRARPSSAPPSPRQITPPAGRDRQRGYGPRRIPPSPARPEPPLGR